MIKQAIVEIRLVAQGIESALGDDDTAAKWIRRLRKAAQCLEDS